MHAIFIEPGVREFLFDGNRNSPDQSLRLVEAARDHGAWAVTLDGVVVGMVSLRPVEADRELIICLSERHWGRGVAFAAATAAMQRGFEELKLTRILAAVDLPNERSHRLLARLGFRPVGESEGPNFRLRNYEALRRSGT